MTNTLKEHGKAIMDVAVRHEKLMCKARKINSELHELRDEYAGRMELGVNALCEHDAGFDPAVFTGSDDMGTAERKAAHCLMLKQFGFMQSGEENYRPTDEYKRYFPQPGVTFAQRQTDKYKRQRDFLRGIIRNLRSAATRIAEAR